MNKVLAWLCQLELRTASQRLRRDLLLAEVEVPAGQVRRELNRQARKTPAVAMLRSIPGVGARTAEAVVALIDDPHRFRNAKAVGRYFGLVPSQDQSGDRNRLGHITWENPPELARGDLFIWGNCFDYPVGEGGEIIHIDTEDRELLIEGRAFHVRGRSTGSSVTPTRGQ